MQDRKCCVSWYHYRDFIEEFADLVPIADRLYVIDAFGAGYDVEVGGEVAHLFDDHLRDGDRRGGDQDEAGVAYGGGF